MFTPLDDIVVLDLSRYLPGPLLTRLLADLGARVIKVEPPTGEGLRWMPPRTNGMGTTFGSLNAGKDSIAVDLKKPEGQAVVRALLPKVDVLVEGFRPGVMDRLGLGWDDLRAAFPRLVGVSLSGYGQSGPLSQRAGHDLNYVARAGLLGLWGPADGPPAVPGVQMADVAGGTWPAAVGVLAALRARDRSGRGRHLDISLFHGVFGFAPYAVPQAAAGIVEPRGAGVLTGGAPCCRCYRTADDRFVAFSPLEPNFFDTFCALAEVPELKGQGYARGADGDRVVAALTALFASKDLAAWEALLDGHDVCVEPVRTPEEALADPELGRWVREVGGHPVHHPNVGVDVDEIPTPAAPAPLGAHTDAVLEGFAVDPALVDAARAAGALSGGTP